MESLANYDSDNEMDAATSTNVKSSKETVRCGMEGDNYDDVQMEMSEDSGSESASKEDEGNDSSPHGSSSSAPSSPTSNDDDSDGDNSSPKPEESQTQTSQEQEAQPDSASPVEKSVKEESVSQKEKDQRKRDLGNRRDRGKDRERDRDKDKDREKGRGRDRDREKDDRDRRKDSRKDDRHRSRSRSRSRDRRERRRSPRRRSRDRDERRRTRDRDRDRRSSSRASRERRRRESDRRHSDTRRRDSDRKRHRSRSRSAERHRPAADSRSSSSSRSSKSDARVKDVKAVPQGPNRGSRSRSKSAEKEKPRVAALVDSRKLYLDKKIDRKLNVLERMGIELKPEAKPPGGVVTPQMLVQRAMEQQALQVKQATGVELPSYYNAAAVNPQRLVDQIQKRKLLWGAKKEDPNKPTTQQPSLNKWQGATFAQDQDGKLTAKFNRLMGIKAPAQVAADSARADGNGSEIIKKQEEMFHNMESQYEVARMATHTHRGLGLGFGTFQPR